MATTARTGLPHAVPARRMVVSFNDERSRWAITTQALDQVRATLPPDWELVVVNAKVSSRGDGAGAPEEVLQAVAGTEVYAGFGFPHELFRAATAGEARLRWVHTGAAGVASLLYPEMLASDVILTNSAGIHAHPMAETVMAVALYFVRGLDFAVRSQAAGAWDQSAFESAGSRIAELDGLTMGILGYGGIGRAVAQRARALGMRVIATRRQTGAPDATAAISAGDAAGTRRVLREADVLVIALPATAETRGLIGAAELALMKPNAVLINVARGSIVVERDLIDALERGVIRGAGLDVFEQEPLPPESPLWKLPNALVLPHVSATTSRFWEREAELIVDNFRRYLRGEPLRNVVDKQRGY